jgi:hypothetical protein
MRSQWIVLFVGISLSVFYLIAVFVYGADPKVVATMIVGGVLAGVIAAYGRHMVWKLAIAILFALLIANLPAHGYDPPGLRIGPIELFPVVMWTGGLLFTWWVYQSLNVPHRWAVTSVLHLGGLFALENFGYYWLGIRLAARKPSLFGLGIIHGPPLLHAIYLTAGPLYLGVARHILRYQLN